ncbi:MAG: DUF938 domain-containing protein [Pontixanthobacter sp.]
MNRHAPATARNSAVIARVLHRELPPAGTILEVASGTGEHAVYMAREFPHLIWLPSDYDVAAIESIAAWRSTADVSNIAEPVLIDTTDRHWPVQRADAIFCCNMVHISPWAATIGLFVGASKLLQPQAPLIVYGPFIDPDIPTAPSNMAFDVSLKSQNPEWGLRHIPGLDSLATEYGFERHRNYTMPANNNILVYRKAAKP